MSLPRGDHDSSQVRRVGKDGGRVLKTKEWYERWKEALLMLVWGAGMFGLGLVIGWLF